MQIAGQITYPGDALILAGGTGLARSFAAMNPQSHLFQVPVTLEPDGATTMLYNSAQTDSSILQVTTSPNDRFVVIEVAKAENPSRGIVVDLESRTEIARLVGGRGSLVLVRALELRRR